jgi:hypothetical protein
MTMGVEGKVSVERGGPESGGEFRAVAKAEFKCPGSNLAAGSSPLASNASRIPSTVGSR